jgi:hypothetical protein
MGLEASYLNMSWWVRGLHINPKALGEMYKPIHKPHQGGEKKKLKSSCTHIAFLFKTPTSQTILYY